MPNQPDTLDLPQGFRAMTANEVARIEGLPSQTVLLYDRSLARVTLWDAASYNGSWERWKLVQRVNGEVVDSVSLYTDATTSEPETYVAIVPIDANDLTPLLRESIYPVIAKHLLADLRAEQSA